MSDFILNLINKYFSFNYLVIQYISFIISLKTGSSTIQFILGKVLQLFN